MAKNEKDKDFSKISHHITDGRLLYYMNRNDIKVYLVLLRYANYITGIAFPSVKTIIALSGVHKDYIKTTVKRLEEMGLILTYQGGKEKSFKKFYGIVKGDWIDIDKALSVIYKPKRKPTSVSRDKRGRFTPIPQNTEKGTPENTEHLFPQNADSCVPQIPADSTVDAEKNERYLEKETISRDRGIEGNTDTNADTNTPDTSKASEPRVSIRGYAVKHGFFKAMDLMYESGSFKKAQDSMIFDMREEERIRKATENFARNRKAMEDEERRQKDIGH